VSVPAEPVDETFDDYGKLLDVQGVVFVRVVQRESEFILVVGVGPGGHDHRGGELEQVYCGGVLEVVECVEYGFRLVVGEVYYVSEFVLLAVELLVPVFDFELLLVHLLAEVERQELLKEFPDVADAPVF